MKPQTWVVALGTLVLLGVTTLAEGAGFQAPNLDSITLADMRGDVFFLASDEMKGRETTKPEADITAAYVKARMERAGLKPAGEDGSWYQTVRLQHNAWEESPAMAWSRGGESGALTWGKDFVSTGGPSTSATLKDLRVAFAGYAIQEAGRQYDDVAGVDLTGKAALVLRYEPSPWRKGGGRNPFSRSSYLQSKEALCRKAGASAILLVTGPESVGASDNNRQLPSPEAGEISPPLRLAGGTERKGEEGLPFFHISIDAADKLLGGAGELGRLQRLFDEGKFNERGDTADLRLDITARSRVVDEDCRNVLGKLEGETDEWIIFGAHHDHLGLGYFGARDADKAMGQIHNGADDNASGVSTILEVAECLAASGRKPKRSFLFITFTGEEKGLLGSSWYVKHPTVPHHRVAAMINIDMVGRLKDNKLALDGTACSKLLDRHCKAAAPLFPELTIAFSERPPMPASDHWPFFSEAGIPVFFPFGGVNAEMHTALDDPETINYAGMVACARMLAEIGWRVSEDPAWPDCNSPKARPLGDNGRPLPPDAPVPVKPPVEREEEFAAPRSAGE